MPLILNASNAYIFRVCHQANLPWILEHGLHCRNSPQPDPEFRSIGNPDLIDRRSRRLVPVAPGGTLSDYVPFYFTPYSLMMFNIHTGYGVEHLKNEDLLIFVSTLVKLREEGLRFVFTDQHAYPSMARYFADISELDQIDWSILQNRDFRHDPEDPGKKERYQAEALVWRHVPLRALHGVCCYSHGVEERIQSMLRERHLDLNVAVRKAWYFE